MYYAPKNDFHFTFFCELSEYAGNQYYSGVVEFQGYIYITPANAEHILVIDENTRVLKFIPHGKQYEDLCNSVL